MRALVESANKDGILLQHVGMLLQPLQGHVVCTFEPEGLSCVARAVQLHARGDATGTCGLLGFHVQVTCVAGQASGAHSAAREPRTHTSLLSAHSATGVALASVAAALVGSLPGVGNGVLCHFAVIQTLLACHPEVKLDGALSSGGQPELVPITSNKQAACMIL